MSLQNVESLKPTGLFTNYIYKAIPLVFDESMSYYETLLGLLAYLKNTVIPTVNNNADAVSELQNLYTQLHDYVENYFNNLDVQQEINNKLDEMTQNGTLTQLIEKYVDPIYQAYQNEINTKVDNLNNKVDNLNDKVNATASGSPAGTYDTLSALQSADPDHSRIYVVLEDGKWYYYNSNTSSWTAGGVYQSTGIGIGEVSFDNLDKDLQFTLNNVNDAVFENNKLNIFNYQDITPDKQLNTTAGSNIDAEFTVKGKMLANQIWEVKNGDILYYSSPYATLVFYDENKKALYSTSTSSKQHQISNASAKYMRYYSNNTDNYTKNFMLSINQPLPDFYVPYGGTNIIQKNSDSISDLENQFEDIKNQIGVNIDKAIILLDFDQPIESMSDNRVVLLSQYGYKPTFIPSTTNPEIARQLQNMGWDISIYSNQSVPDASTINNSDPQSLQNWDNYVKNMLDQYNNAGFFNQVMWSCWQNNYGIALETALKKYGFKMARGGGIGTFSPYINETFTQTPANGIYSNNLDSIKSSINYAINNKEAINIFTHLIVDNPEEDTGYNCLKSVYTQLLDFIKEKEEANQCIVMNYREFYQLLYQKSSYNYDYNRIVKTINHNYN